MPRFTPEQVRRRQLIAGALAVILLLVLGGCTALLIGGLRGGSDGAVARTPFEADDDALSVRAIPPDAAATENLPDGVDLAQNEVMGLDVSAHQKEIDWEEVAADGYSFAYIKATEGAGYTDAMFQQNWDGARAAGLTPGAYHYFTLCSSGADQATDFLAAAPPDDAAHPAGHRSRVRRGLRGASRRVDAQAEIDDFTAAVEKAWGRRLLIYSSKEWRDHYGLPVTEPRPDWPSRASDRPQQEDWAVWQLRFDGTVSGIEGGVDIHVARIEIRARAPPSRTAKARSPMRSTGRTGQTGRAGPTGRASGRLDGLLDAAGSGEVARELLSVQEHRRRALGARSGLGLHHVLDPGQIGALGDALADVQAGGLVDHLRELVIGEPLGARLGLEQGRFGREP